MFTQPTPVLSLGYELRSPSLSSQPPLALVGEQTSLSAWWVLVGTDPLCRNLSVLPSAFLLLLSPPWFRSFPPSTPHLRQWRGFLGCGIFSSFKLPHQGAGPIPILLSLFFLFFFCPTQVRGEFLAFWEVWGLLPAFSRCSVGVVPHVDVFLIYLWGRRWSPRLTPLPSWRSLLPYVFNICRDWSYSDIISHSSN